MKSVTTIVGWLAMARALVHVPSTSTKYAVVSGRAAAKVWRAEALVQAAKPDENDGVGAGGASFSRPRCDKYR